MKKLLVSLIMGLCLVTIGSSKAFASNTSAYLQIKELKVWSSSIDVYFTNGEEHQCVGGGSLTRFKLDAQKENYYSMLVAAFLSGRRVMLRYSCDTKAVPWITGVRVR